MSTSDDRQTHAVHRIRLGSQWDLEPLPDGETPQSLLPGVQRLKHLSDYSRAAGTEFNGRIRLARCFGRPTGLTGKERVELVGDVSQVDMAISLNGQILKPQPVTDPAQQCDTPTSLRFDVSALLQDSNRLAIALDLPDTPDAPGVIRDVRLEIFAADP